MQEIPSAMKILNGKKISQNILNDLKKDIVKIRKCLTLAVVLIGEDPASLVYCRQKEKACKEVGINFKLFQFPGNMAPNKLKKEIEKIGQDSRNSGIIIQLPLPKRFETAEILNLLPPEKDIDVLSEKNLVKFYEGKLPIVPPLVCATSRLLKEANINLSGKNVVVIGTGRLVGFPVILWLIRERATVSLINELTKNHSFFTKNADVIISGAGKPDIIKGDNIKKGAVLLDAGTSLKNKKVVGDVDFKSVSKLTGYLSPVPGGMGPLTVACLLENLVKVNSFEQR